MNIYTRIPAYTYRITCLPTGQFYYGYREGNIKKGLLPKNDLWVHYFTSSPVVKSLIEQFGKDAFSFEVLDEDVDPIKMYWQEQEYIKLNWADPLLLNRFYKQQSQSVGFRATSESSKKGVITRRRKGTDKIAAQKMLKTKKENGTDKIGAQKIIQTLKIKGTLSDRQLKIAANKRTKGTDKAGAAQAIKTQRANGTLIERAKKMVLTKRERGTDKTGARKTIQKLQKEGTLRDRQLKIAESRRNNGTDKIGAQKRAEIISLTWELTYQDSSPIIIKNLAKFCRENNLDNSAMVGCAKKGTAHKGWKCKKV